MRKNDWQKRFGAKRRAIDKAILAECERQIALEVQERPKLAPDARNAIARAFGRPVN